MVGKLGMEVVDVAQQRVEVVTLAVQILEAQAVPVPVAVAVPAVKVAVIGCGGANEAA
jgi:hypothetical protein